MRTKQWIVLAVVLTALVLLMILVVRAGPPAQEPEHQGSIVGQAGVGTGFTYQGQLESGGEPVNESCDMAFRLYDGESGGSQVGSAITRTVPVVDGLFTVHLDFGGVFTGDARWLALAVRCPAGNGGYDTLSPRQPLSPVPYAVYSTHAMTATMASGVEAGAIIPTNLHGVMGPGINGQVLASDGSGGFAWKTTGAVRRLVQDFVLASGERVSAGDVVAFANGMVYGDTADWEPGSVFTETGAMGTVIGSLSSKDFVIAYQDDSGSMGAVIVGTVSGRTLSWGTPSVFYEGSIDYLALTVLSATQFVVAYQDGNNADYGTARVGTVGSGGTVTWGPPSAFSETDTRWCALGALSATEFVVAYYDGGTNFDSRAIVGTVGNGDELTWGAASPYEAVSSGYIAVSALSPTQFVVAYQYGAGSVNPGRAIVGTVSGGALSWGPPSSFNMGIVYFVEVSALSGTDFVVAYRDGINYNYGSARVGTVSGNELSWGEATVFNAASTYYIGVSALSPTEVVVAYQDAGHSTYGKARVGTVGGGIISWDSESTFNAASTGQIAVGALSATDLVVAYRDGGNLYYGTARLGHRWRRIGTAESTASGGQTVAVIIDGVSDVHSGLVPGGVYYIQADSSLGLTPTAHRVGLAISATELILDQMW